MHPRRSIAILTFVLVASAWRLAADQSPAPKGLKVYISVDMEGVAGLAISPSQMAPTGVDYQYGRRLMTAEANAAIAGAFDAGAAAVLVSDSHGSETNLLADQLDRRAELITGKPRPYVMMEGIDSTFDAAVFVGYHPRASSLGHIDHTLSYQIKRVSLNGAEVGEDGLNAALAAHFGVPVVFLSGDQAVTEQATAAYPGIVAVAVKEAIGRFAVKTINPADAVARITAGVKDAVSRAKSIKPVQCSVPITIEFEVSHTGAVGSGDARSGHGTRRTPGGPLCRVRHAHRLSGCGARLDAGRSDPAVTPHRGPFYRRIASHVLALTQADQELRTSTDALRRRPRRADKTL